jgi:ABC-type transport system involved in multi-copper enzyme maturation permease subunit
LPGILTIAKKEFTDHVSDNTFLLSFAVLLVVIVAGSYLLVLNVQDWTLNESLMRHFIEEGLAWKLNFSGFTMYVVEPFTLLGVFVAITLSFNSINKERGEGSLKVLLSYPIRKSKIIIGKLIGGLLAITIVVLSTMTVSFTMLIYFLGIPVNLDFLSRAAWITALGVLLLFIYLCVGTAVSVMVRDASAALMGILLILVALRSDFITLLVTLASSIASIIGIKFSLPLNLNYYPGSHLYWDTNLRNFWLPSPSESYLGFTSNIIRFVNPSGYPTVYIPLEFEWLLPKGIDLAQAMVVFAVTALALCIVLFVRREVE